MRILVAVDPVDFRRGIDGLGGLCRQVLRQPPVSIFGMDSTTNPSYNPIRTRTLTIN